MQTKQKYKKMMLYCVRLCIVLKPLVERLFLNITNMSYLKNVTEREQWLGIPTAGTFISICQDHKHDLEEKVLTYQVDIEKNFAKDIDL